MIALAIADSRFPAPKSQHLRSVCQDAKVQELLTWIHIKAEAINTQYKLAAIRALYLALALACAIELALVLNLESIFARNFVHNLTRNRQLCRKYAREIVRTLGIVCTRAPVSERNLAQSITFAHTLAYDFAGDIDGVRDVDLGSELTKKLQHLWTQLPKVTSKQNRKEFQNWWTANGYAWTEKLHQVTVRHRNTRHDWQFTESQNQALQRYHDANKFLVELLKEPGAVSDTVRQEIEDNLLLPIAELKRRLPDLYS